MQFCTIFVQSWKVVPKYIVWKSIKRRGLATAATPLRVVFFGNDDFSLPHLHTLKKCKMENKIKDLAVVVSSQKNEVFKYATAHDMESYIWPDISSIPPVFDLAVVVSFGHLIPNAVLNLFPKGMINVHPSLLPEWRGAAPLEHTILSGQARSGISVMQLTERFDRGALLLQKHVDIAPDETSVNLRKEMATLGSNLLLTVIRDFDYYKRQSKEQGPSRSSVASKLTLEHARVDWNCSMEQIDRQFRALGHHINLRSKYKNTSVRLLDMVPLKEMRDIIPHISQECDGEKLPVGYPLYNKEKEIVCIKCKNGWVGFKNINIRKSMSAKDFGSGYLQQKENKNILFTSLDCGLRQFEHWTKPSENIS